MDDTSRRILPGRPPSPGRREGTSLTRWWACGAPGQAGPEPPSASPLPPPFRTPTPRHGRKSSLDGWAALGTLLHRGKSAPVHFVKLEVGAGRDRQSTGALTGTNCPQCPQTLYGHAFIPGFGSSTWTAADRCSAIAAGGRGPWLFIGFPSFFDSRFTTYASFTVRSHDYY